MEGGDVKVYGAWISPFSRRVELALRLKGVSYEYVKEDLANKSPDLLKYNPVHNKVPVLLHHGRPIAESIVVLEYIDETWKTTSPLLPEDPYQRAMARFWVKFIEDECFKALWMSCWSRGPMQEQFMQRSRECLSLLENELKDKKFFGGDTIGMQDIAANFIAHGVPVLQEVAGISLINEDKHPILCRWAKDFLSHDVVKDCLPYNYKEKSLAFFNDRKEAILAANGRMVY